MPPAAGPPLGILYDHQMFALQRFGGITRVFVELARQLSARPDCAVSWHRGYHLDGYDVSDFRGRLSRYWSVDRPLPGLGVWPGLRRWHRERVNRYLFRAFAATMRGPVDVYHPSYFDPHLPAIPRARRLAVTVYDLILERFFADVPRFRPAIDGKRRLVERADVVFVISEQTRRDLVELLGVDPARTVLTPLATDLIDVPPAPLPPGLADRPYLLYVGPRTDYKNFRLLAEAFAADDWLRRELRVVCLGSTPFEAPERAFFAEHGLADRFIQVSGDDRLLRALYDHATALVWTSRYEGFGIPPLEALETGCPVLCAPVSSLPEVVGDAALFFDPDRPDELAVCIRQVVEDTGLRAALVARGRARAARFSWVRTAEATLAGYRAVTG